MQKITPFLWFDGNAEEAVNFYTSVFGNSKVVSIKRYPGGPMEGKILTAVFELEGQAFMAIDGGPHYTFSGAISLYVDCASQDEVDRLWEKLTADGEVLMCGWCTDKFGVTWQIIPSALIKLMNDPDQEKAGRVMDAMLKMKKIDVPTLERAYEGVEV
jgi:predicted 3-demethylubiquinone-9 3-methyltransferase (glyoxalase superfamily)